LPDADLKLFVIASAEERARRRYLERREAGEQVCFCDVLANIKDRDAIDSGRKTAPLKAADDAVVIDTTDLDITHMFAKVDALVVGDPTHS
jgi:cytidylate kinase